MENLCECHVATRRDTHAQRAAGVLSRRCRPLAKRALVAAMFCLTAATQPSLAQAVPDRAVATRDAGRGHAAAAHWPAGGLAQRDFAADALLVDEVGGRAPSLWLVAHRDDGTAHALDFFTGERVAHVRVERDAAARADVASRDGQARYSFVDADGRHHASLRALSQLQKNHPGIHAGWQRDGVGHDVVLGAYLFERAALAGMREEADRHDTAVEPARFFGDEPSCEPRVYVARTQGSRHQDSAPGFTPRTRIIAGYDAKAGCWHTRPQHAVDLGDNTFIIVTGARVFRLRASDLSPAGDAPGLRLIDVDDRTLQPIGASVPSPASARADADASPVCPSQDFATFLRHFADVEDDRIRRAYTAMPLEYVVPSHTLLGDPDLPPFTIIAMWSHDRSRRFDYRYLPTIGDYRNVGFDARPTPDTTAGHYRFPMTITAQDNGDHEVVMGMEYESDVFAFSRRDGCWWLTRVTNPRD